MSREPHYEKGQLVWHRENQEVWHVVDRYRNADHDMIYYKVTDPTHTAYRHYDENTLRNVAVDLPISVLYNYKPSTVLDLEDLLRYLQNLATFAEIEMDGGNAE